MTESRAKRVRIKEVGGWTLGLLVDYIYTAEIQVTEDNVQVSCNGVLTALQGLLRVFYWPQDRAGRGKGFMV